MACDANLDGRCCCHTCSRFAESHEEVTVLFEERSMRASEVLQRAQDRARENGSQLQLAMLRDKTQPDKPQDS